MGTLKEDIKTESNWIVKAFKADQLKLDYTIDSFIEIDKFFIKHSKNGKAKSGGRLSKNLGSTIFSIGAYIGETIIKTTPNAKWITNDNDPMGEMNVIVKLHDGTEIWPMQKVMKRFKNGSEDSIYPYGHEITKQYTKKPFNENFWTFINEDQNDQKPWWKFW